MIKLSLARKLFAFIVTISLIVSPLGGFGAPATIEVATSKKIYFQGEKVVASGNVFPTPPFTDVTVQVLKPNGEPWAIAQVSPRSDGTFSAIIATLGVREPPGEYRMLVSYGDVSVRLTFQVLSSKVFDVRWEDRVFIVTVVSDSRIENLNFTQPDKSLTLTVHVATGKTGFSNISLPKELLEGPYVVTVDDATAKPTLIENVSHSSMSITYGEGSHTIKIVGSKVIPEFPSSLILPLFAAILIPILLRIRGVRGIGSHRRSV